MSEAELLSFEPSFNRAVKVQSTDDRLSSDAGTLLLREADHKLGLVESLAAGLRDPRDPAKVRYTQVELLRERLYALALGYGAGDDLDVLAHDSVFKAAVWDRAGDQVVDERLGSQPTTSRLLGVLASRDNRGRLRESLSDWVHRHLRASGGDRRVLRGTLDVDAPYVTRRSGRPPKEGYEFTVELGWHKAEDWKYPHGLVLVALDKPDPKTGQLELFPRYFFLLTTWTKEEKDGDELLAHYRRRGTFEDRFSE